SAFDNIWQKYILPLEGKTITSHDGLTNTILKVDWSGIQRVSSTGNTSTIDIEIFRWAVAQILSHGSVTRTQINHQYPKRASSAVALILSHVPLFEFVS